MKRRFRLRRSTDIKRVRRSGKSYAHPFIVLYTQKTEHPHARIAVSAGSKVGNAVQRNRVKRLLREAVKPYLSQLTPGSDVLLIGRSPLVELKLEPTRSVLQELLIRAKLLSRQDDDRISAE